MVGYLEKLLAVLFSLVMLLFGLVYKRELALIAQQFKEINEDNAKIEASVARLHERIDLLFAEGRGPYREHPYHGRPVTPPGDFSPKESRDD